MVTTLTSYRVVRTSVELAQIMAEHAVQTLSELNEVYDGNAILLECAERFGLDFDDLERNDWEIGNAIAELAACIRGCGSVSWDPGDTREVAGYPYVRCLRCSRLVRLRRVLRGWHWC